MEKDYNRETFLLFYNWLTQQQRSNVEIAARMLDVFLLGKEQGAKQVSHAPSSN